MEGYPLPERRRADRPVNRVAVVAQTCACTLSDDDIERLGILARSGR
jgi:hypothetical protein